MGALKNNVAFSHPIFRSSVAASQYKNPRNPKKRVFWRYCIIGIPSLFSHKPARVREQRKIENLEIQGTMEAFLPIWS
jgi:hypothetical protein